MSRWHRRLSVALFAACVMSRGVRLGADERKLLPAFTVVAPTGAAVAISELSTEPHALLVYVVPDCRACDRLIAALIDWQPTLPANRLVIIIGAATDPARTYAQDRHIAGTGGIAWYADPLQTGASALGLQHMPALVALDDGRVEWTVSGVLNAPSALESIVRSWTAR
ncbi:MAG: hypothetical protein JWL71_2020 [Acidobacteria bacterium]|nr:hypothetical protein [Acidobacteriota bacterium]